MERVTLVACVYAMLFIVPGSFLCLFTVRERIKYRWYVLAPLVLLNGVVYYALRLVSWLGILPYLVVAFLSLRKVTRVEPLKLLYIMLVVVTYLLFSNTVFYSFEGSAYTWDWSDLDTVMIGFSVSSPIMAWFLRRKVWPLLRNMQTSQIRWLWVIPATFMALNVILGSSHIQSLLTFRMSWPYTLMSTAFALATAGVCFLVLDMLKKTRDVTRYREDMRIVDTELHMQAKRFRELSAYMRDVRVLRHDMRHHMRMLRGMLEEGRTDEALAYLQEYETDTAQDDVLPVCTNYVVDLVARRFHEIARQSGIDMQLELAVPGKSWVSDVDLCTVLGNLLENAIHACKLQKTGERYIRLNIRVGDEEATIYAENSCSAGNASEEEMMYAGVPKGSGRGTFSIEAVAEKYRGMAKFAKEGEVFRVSVLMYCQERAVGAGG